MEYKKGDEVWCSVRGIDITACNASIVKYILALELPVINLAWIPFTIEKIEIDAVTIRMECDSTCIVTVEASFLTPRDKSDSAVLKKGYTTDAALFDSVLQRYKCGQFWTPLLNDSCALYVNPCNHEKNSLSCFELYKKTQAQYSQYLIKGADIDVSSDIDSSSIALKAILSASIQQNYQIIMNGKTGGGKTELCKALCQHIIAWDDCKKLLSHQPVNEEITETEAASSFSFLGSNFNPMKYGITRFEGGVGESLTSAMYVLDVFSSTSTQTKSSSSRYFSVVRIGYNTDGFVNALAVTADLHDSNELHFGDRDFSMSRIFTLVVAAAENMPETFEIPMREKHALKITDTKQYVADVSRLKNMLLGLGMSEGQWLDSLRALLSIIHLQTLAFVGDPCVLSGASEQLFDHVSRVLGVSSSVLRVAICPLGATVEQINRNIDILSVELSKATLNFFLDFCSINDVDSCVAHIEIIAPCGICIFDPLESPIPYQRYKSTGKLWRNVTEDAFVHALRERYLLHSIQSYQNDDINLEYNSDGSVLYNSKFQCMIPSGSFDTALLEMFLGTDGIIDLVNGTGPSFADKEVLLAKIMQAHLPSGHICLLDSNHRLPHLIGIDPPSTFGVRHTFGNVNYDVNSFMAEFVSEHVTPEPLRALFKSITIEYLKDVQLSVTQGIRTILKHIRATASSSNVFNVICLRPRQILTCPPSFDQEYMIRQFESYSVSNIATLSSFAFPIRLAYALFFQRYHSLGSLQWRNRWYKDDESFRSSFDNDHLVNACKALIEEQTIQKSIDIYRCSKLFVSMSLSFSFELSQSLATLLTASSKLFALYSKYKYKFRYLKRKRNLERLKTILGNHNLKLYMVGRVFEAVVLIQRAARERLGLSEIVGLKKIQKLFRGWHRRCVNSHLVFQLKLKRSLRKGIRAAVGVQSFFRRMKFYKHYSRMKRACQSLQLWIRGRIAKLRFSKIVKLVHFLQRNFRRFSARNKCDKLRSAMLLVIESNKLTENRLKELNLLYKRTPTNIIPSFGSNVIQKRGLDVVYDRYMAAFDIYSAITDSYRRGWLSSLHKLSNILAQSTNVLNISSADALPFKSIDHRMSVVDPSAKDFYESFRRETNISGHQFHFGNDSFDDSLYDAIDFDKIKHKLLALSYTTKGSDLNVLFDKINKTGDGQIDMEELSSYLKKNLQLYVSDNILIRIIEKINNCSVGTTNKSVKRSEFIKFISEREDFVPRKEGLLDSSKDIEFIKTQTQLMKIQPFKTPCPSSSLRSKLPSKARSNKPNSPASSSTIPSPSTLSIGVDRMNLIAAGASHTIIVDDSQNIYSFGFGDRGQLGHGDQLTCLERPRMILNFKQMLENYEASTQSDKVSIGRCKFDKLPRNSLSYQRNGLVRQVACGKDHTLLLTEGGSVWSWGSNKRGQLGHSGFQNCSSPKCISETLARGGKTLSSVFARASQVACGLYHSVCFQHETGTFFTWGAAEMLGENGLKVADSSIPKLVPFFSRRRVQAMISGESHIVVVSCNEVFSWGSNVFGQLGRDSGGRLSLEPQPVALPAFSEAQLLKAQLVSGARHTFLLLQQSKVVDNERLEKSSLYAWGSNKYGQCGVGSSDQVISAARRVSFPSVTNTLICLQSLHASLKHSIARTVDGAVFVWGTARLESSFSSSESPILSPTPIHVVMPHLYKANVCGVNVICSPSLSLTMLDVGRPQLRQEPRGSEPGPSTETSPEVHKLVQSPYAPPKLIPKVDACNLWKQCESKDDALRSQAIYLNIDGVSVPLVLATKSVPLGKSLRRQSRIQI